MKIEKIDKWLDDKYGISYTELVKIKEYLLKNKERLERQLDYANEISGMAINRKNMYKKRIDKAIECMNNTMEISSVKDMFAIMDNIENILRGKDNE